LGNKIASILRQQQGKRHVRYSSNGCYDKSAGATKEQATLALKPFSTALETTTEEFVKIDPLTDLKLAMIEMRVDITKQLSDINMKLADVKSDTAGAKNIRLIAMMNHALTIPMLAAVGTLTLLLL
jgi:hypothetical protein